MKYWKKVESNLFGKSDSWIHLLVGKPKSVQWKGGGIRSSEFLPINTLTQSEPISKLSLSNDISDSLCFMSTGHGKTTNEYQSNSNYLKWQRHLFVMNFEFLLWSKSYLLIMKGRSLWAILQPASGGRLRWCCIMIHSPLYFNTPEVSLWILLNLCTHIKSEIKRSMKLSENSGFLI